MINPLKEMLSPTSIDYLSYILQGGILATLISIRVKLRSPEPVKEEKLPKKGGYIKRLLSPKLKAYSPTKDNKRILEGQESFFD